MNVQNNKKKTKDTPQKKKHPGGRPIKFSAVKRELVLNLIRSGASDKSACKEAGITYQTFFLWRKKGEEEKELPEDQQTEYYPFYQDLLQAEENRKTQKVNQQRNHARKSKSVHTATIRKQEEPGINPENFSLLGHDRLIFKLDVRTLTPHNVFAMTVWRNPFIALEFCPTDVQIKLLRIGDSGIINPNKKTEVLLSGGSGSGKTTALLLAALQYVCVPDYQALLLRGHSPPGFSLSEKMKKMLAPFLQSIKIIDENEFEIWKFPSGATITFGYVAEQFDISNFEHLRFHFIGFDELIHFKKADYNYLLDRMHQITGNKIPLRIYSSGNPDGPDENRQWIKVHFIDCSEEEMKQVNRFLLLSPIDDNPYVKRGEIEKSVRELDPITIERLLNGNWAV